MLELCILEIIILDYILGMILRMKTWHVGIDLFNAVK